VTHHSRIWHVRIRQTLAAARREAASRKALVPEDLVAIGIEYACTQVEEVVDSLLSPAQYLSLAEWGQAQSPAVPRHTVRRWVQAGHFDDRDVVLVGRTTKLRAQARPLFPDHEEAA
jgi:hypothetical protein